VSGRGSLASTCGLLACASLSCRKVPIVDVYAAFALADTAWFEAEQTLFVFYEVTAEQGLGDPSVIEITYTTDDQIVPWTILEDFEPVHTHVPVDCGPTTMCGSASIHVPIQPRNVQLRMRYHVDGALTLDPGDVFAFNVVDSGAPWSRRSLVVYGVFDERNARVQWRSRNVFPTVRNEQATELGLRRRFEIEGQRFGTATLATGANVYGYGSTCPEEFVDAGLVGVSTEERAVFDGADLPLGASDASVVCADATVTDATGTFTTNAIARKNPEVRPAFPALHSPVEDATPIRFFLGPCGYTISEQHEAMIRQRLELGDVPTTCIDHWSSPGFVGDLVVLFTDAVEAERPNGRDMVLVVGLQQDEDGVSRAVEEALAQVVPEERDRTSPRLAGAFVLDSDIRGLELDELAPVTLWCPSTVPTGADGSIPDASQRTCAVAPDNPDFDLGPFSFGALPILPSREQYLDFVDTYSDAQAGKVTSLAYRTPEFAATADHVLLDEYGAATFLNDEVITADSGDAFSYCVSDGIDPFVFRTASLGDPAFLELLLQVCAEQGLEGCETAIAYGVVPLAYLPEWHATFPEGAYELGIAWDFPFLLRMEYEAVTAGSVSAFGLSVPFGIASSSESYYGTEMWTEERFSLEELLTQCGRFCDHPTFDSAGVYHVTDPFRRTYAHACYLPDYPALGDSGFPRDP
jgi:hypothetical protein